MPGSGVRYDSELETIIVAAWANYKTFEFQELEGRKQAYIIAAYRIQERARAVSEYMAYKKRGKS